MQFDKIRFDGKLVELEYKMPLPGGGGEDRQAHGEGPGPTFKQALAAFTSYVIWVHSWPADIAERIEVRGVAIKRPDDAPRGITVTGLLKCPHARNSTSTFNTPYLAQPPENYSGDGNGFLSAAVIGFVDELEEEATRFKEGEREQTSLPLGEAEPSDNTKEFNARSAAAEGATTRKPKGKKKPKDFVPGVGDVVNANATEVLDNDGIRQLLLTVERDVPVDAIATWVSSERSLATDWAHARLKEMVGQLEDIFVPTEPACVIKAATLPLSAEEWTAPAPKPIRVSDAAAQAIQEAAAKG